MRATFLRTVFGTGLFACAGALVGGCSDSGRPPRLEVLSYVRTIGGGEATAIAVELV